MEEIIFQYTFSVCSVHKSTLCASSVRATMDAFCSSTFQFHFPRENVSASLSIHIPLTFFLVCGAPFSQLSRELPEIML